MHTVLLALFLGGSVTMTMFAAAFVSIREAELRASSSGVASTSE